MRAPALTTRSSSATRSGFTLIELLVVIAIIAILSALSAAAVQKVRRVGQRVAVVDDLNKLDMSCSKFKTDFGTNVPQRFRFPSTVPDPSIAAPTAAQIQEAEGYRFLRGMFRGWPANTTAGVAIPDIFFNPLRDGTFLPADKVNGQLIDGSQCLVFFLGGPRGLGFTNNGPNDPGTNTSKKGPYFEFAAGRIDIDATPRAVAADGFAYRYGFKDTYGTPYAFFSAGSSEVYSTTAWVGPTILNVGATGSLSPFQTTTIGSVPAKFVNPGRIQIISAGYDRKYGAGGYWVPGTGTYIVDLNQGGDDIGNFNNGIVLGTTGG